MSICICQAVSDSAIRKAVEQGVRNFPELSAATGCGTQCGSCVKMAREVLDKALEDIGSPKSTVSLEVVSTG